MVSYEAVNTSLGMQIIRKLWLRQKKYIEEVLKIFNMTDCKPMKTPKALKQISSDQRPKSEEEIEEMTHIPYASTVRSLTYIMVCKRPDIALTVGVQSHYMSNPAKEHYSAVKQVLRFLHGTSDFPLSYGNWMS